MTISKYGPYVVVLGVFLALLLFYTAYDKASKTLNPQKLVDVLAFKDAHNTWREINKVLALEAIGLIAGVFLLGPLSKLWPRTFAKFLCLRKPVGIAGFGLALVHSAYSAVEFYGLDTDKMIFANPKLAGFLAAVGAIVIFLGMTITSSKQAMERLGYRNWKALQTFGYVGLLFAALHFYILETKPETGFDVRPFGMLFFYLAVAALVLRLVIIFVNPPQRKSYEEHTGEGPKAEAE